MNSNRRDFLKGTAWMGAAAVAAGCVSKDLKIAGFGGSMQGYAAPALKKIRVGVVGLGMRGPGAVHRLAAIPGVEVAALCDLHEERVKIQQDWLKKNKKPEAKGYVGPEAYKALCESDIDVVYNATGWNMHVPIALYAMEHGKHVFVEVPSAFTVEECWQLVETSERTRMHCMQLENCCYGEAEMLCLNLVRQGFLGDIVHGEGAYIHDLRSLCYADPNVKSNVNTGYESYWRLRHNAAHKGNHYDTHGLGPVCQYMNINRGDRFDYLVSLESNQFNFELYGKTNFPGHSWKENLKVDMGDMNTTLVKTVKGRSIMIQHDVSSPRPYSRLNVCTGTKGIFNGISFAKKPEDALANGNICHFGWEDKNGKGCHRYFDFAKTEEIRAKYKHPLWKKAGEFAKAIGGHGGMDFLMDLRWCYCLQNGLPLDTDVYDLASWCCLAELSEKSVRNRSASMDVPDFTKGGWKTAAPLGIVDIDLQKMGLDVNSAKKDTTQLNV